MVHDRWGLSRGIKWRSRRGFVRLVGTGVTSVFSRTGWAWRLELWWSNRRLGVRHSRVEGRKSESGDCARGVPGGCGVMWKFTGPVSGRSSGWLFVVGYSHWM